MKFFKNQDNKVYALSDEDAAPIIDEDGNEQQSPWIKDDWIEITEQEKDDIVSPPLSIDDQFQAEMDALNAQYDRDMIEATNKYNVAVARDGSTETEKVNDARAWIADLDAQYDADQLAILNKYYGE